MRIGKLKPFSSLRSPSREIQNDACNSANFLPWSANNDHLKSSFVRLIPRRLRSTIRKIAYSPAQILDTLYGNHPPLTPPKHLMSVGPGDFHNIGNHMLHLFKSLGKLKSTDHVLDIGSGVGRMAVPLTKFLEKDSQYCGFDIVKDAVKWCQHNISTQHPNFRFEHVDLYNKSYNDRGKLSDQSHQFGYEDASFDFIIATSVFTHMLPTGLKQYLSESFRVLKKGGRCFFTFFIIHPHAEKVIRAGQSGIPFEFGTGPYWIVDRSEPEKAIAYQHTYLYALMQELGFEFENDIHLGSWAKNPKSISYQDVIIASKK